MQITNKKGEELYLFVRTSSKEFNRPFITIKTWEDAIKLLHDHITERDDDLWYSKCINVTIKDSDENNKSASAQMVRKQKGWGGDYYEEISIEPAYDFYW